MPKVRRSLFEHTIHFSAEWVRACVIDGVHAIGAVSTYVCGKSSFLGRAINSPHTSSEIAFSGLSLPPGVDLDREDAWVYLDALERKADGNYRQKGGNLPRLGSHIDATIPYGMNDAQARRMVEGFAGWLTQTYGVAVEYGCHNTANPRDHAHFLVSTRSLAEANHGKKVREFNGIAMQHKDRELGVAITQKRADGTVKSVSSAFDSMRAEWARRVGAEIGKTPDHRSFARRGLTIQPVPYVSRGTIEFEKREARRTGASPSWRVERRRRLDERARSSRHARVSPRSAAPETILAATHVRNDDDVSVLTAAKMARRHAVSLRQQINENCVAAVSRSRGRTLRLGSSSPDQDGAMQLDDLANRETHSAALPKGWLQPRAADRARGRYAIPKPDLERQQNAINVQSQRHLAAVAVVERLIPVSAIVALRRLRDLASRFDTEAKALNELHDRQWTAFATRQRQAWRQHMAEFNGTMPSNRIQASEPLISTPWRIANRLLLKLQFQLAEVDDSSRTVLLQRELDHDARLGRQGRADIDERARAAVRVNQPRASETSGLVVELAAKAGSQWQHEIMDLCKGHEPARKLLLIEHQEAEVVMRRRHRLKLKLMARLVEQDAVRALRGLVALAIQSSRELALMLDTQGLDWIELVRKQRMEWPALPNIEIKPRPINPVIFKDGDVPPRARHPQFERDLGSRENAMPESVVHQVAPPSRPPSHVRIVNELAVRLIVMKKRSSHLTQMLAGYLDEPAREFGERADARYNEFLSIAPLLGPGQPNSLQPRVLKDLSTDPIVRNSPELRALVDAVIEQIAGKRLATTPTGRSPNVTAEPAAITRKGKDIA